MKYVYIVRHAPKDENGLLTAEGKKIALTLKKHFKLFNIVISSDTVRTQETAYLVTGMKPIIDKRASIIDITPEQEIELFHLGENHPFGIAGVIFETPEYKDLVKIRGETLVELVKDTITKLPEDGTALIVTHDGPMVAAERILKKLPLDKAEKTYGPLQGYTVNERLEVETLN